MTKFRGLEIVNKFKVTDSNYEISVLEDGTYTCNCPSWIFHKGNKVNCKHINEYLNNRKLLSEEVVFQQVKSVKCAFCGKGTGVIPIVDDETLKEVLICESCDYERVWFERRRFWDPPEQPENNELYIEWSAVPGWSDGAKDLQTDRQEK